MKKAQWTDLFREIRKSKGRYLSLLFIVALGTAFYAGVRSAEPDMTASVDRYYDETNFMDVRVIGTLGLTGDDVQAIADTEGIVRAEGSYSAELFAVCQDNQPVMSVLSACDDMNYMTVQEGRMPQASDECFMDTRFMTNEGYSIGDTVTLIDEDGESPENLVTDTYTIVGSGTWSWYLSISRGSASIGDGSLDAFMVLSPEAFDMDYYTVIYALVDGASDLNSFSDEYDDAVQLVTDRIEDISGERCEIRYAEVYADAEAELADARKEVEDAEQELADARQKLTDGETEYEDGQIQYADGLKKYEDGQKAYADGQKEYEDGRKKLADSRKELDDGWIAYQDGSARLEDAKVELAAGQSQLKDGEEQIAAAKAELDSGQKEIDSQKNTLDEKAAQVAEGLKACEDGEKQLAAAESQLASKEQELEAGQATYEEGLNNYEAGISQLKEAEAMLEAGQQQLESAQSQLDELYAQLEQVKAVYGEESEEYQQLYAQWSQGNAELQAQKGVLEESRAQYEASAAELAAAKETLDETAAELESGRQQIASGKKELELQREELAASKNQLDDAQTQIQAGYAAISSAQSELDSGKKTLQEKEVQLESSRQQLAEGQAQLEDSQKQLAEALTQLKDGEKAYSDGEAQLTDAKTELEDAKTELEDAEKELADAKKELEDARTELDDGWKEYQDALEEAEPKLEDARQKIEDGEKTLGELEQPEWYVLDRNTVQTSVEYGMDAERIGAIGKVFPAIFFLVAALVSLTTMTRMIEEERTLIGTMKALGYGKLSIAGKYILYALSATLVGGIFGVILGSKLLPYVIMTAYGMLYSNTGFMLMPLHWDLCLFSIGLAVLCTVGAAFAACYKALLSTPASLMRPPTPKQGKRVFLEYVPFIWKRLNFSMKSTIRNLVRYKKRFFMTIFGIGGCMALLLVSFGLHDSIAEIVDNQYKNIWTYTVSCNIDAGASLEEKQELIQKITDEQDDIESGMLARQISLDASTEEAEKTIYLYVVEDKEKVKDYLDLHDRVTDEKYELTDDGVIITEKVANTLGVKAGDSVTLKLDDTTRKEVTIAAVAENYLYHYIYLTPALYEQLYGEEPEYNELYLKLAEGTDADRENELAEYLLRQEMVTSTSLVTELQTTVDNMLNSLNLVVWVLIISAGLLVFVVLFNLNNINISERRRELASLKVLGFYDMEVAMYVYRENVFLTIFGVIAGIFMGAALHQYMILTLEVDMIMFGRNIRLPSYLYSILFTIGFAVVVNLSMYYKLRQIDMVESLKSVE